MPVSTSLVAANPPARLHIIINVVHNIGSGFQSTEQTSAHLSLQVIAEEKYEENIKNKLFWIFTKKVLFWHLIKHIRQIALHHL